MTAVNVIHVKVFVVFQRPWFAMANRPSEAKAKLTVGPTGTTSSNLTSVRVLLER